jgi:alpha-amylase/alpha-mannosidase (GH57 family)
MHQPYYEDLVTREHSMPWVRLHGLKDYYGMVALAREFPDVRMTFNVVPSLLVQLEAFAAGRARDRYLDLGLKAADALSDDDIDFILGNFFHAQHDRMIRAYPRYGELLDRRGPLPITPDTRRRFDGQDLIDLQVWQKLAWIDPGWMGGERRVRALLAKGQGFTEGDKAVLRGVELDLLNAVVPAYRDAWGSGQVEVSVSPFYHPILPLLCDAAVYRRTHPDAELPREPFVYPEDALEQLTRAAAYAERVLGRRPAGVWPSEGSVSDDMVPLVARAGFEWMATDEAILGRTLGVSFGRDEAGHVTRPGDLYRPYVVSSGGARVACVFRDHVLSDLIGFTYAGWPAERAADDFVARLVEGGRRFAVETGGEDAVISVILDGENAWEHFEGGGRPFLKALYARLSGHPELRTVTMSEACKEADRELPGIFPGSWIDANFYIWIGHRDDRRAWDQLARARQAAASHARGTPAWAQAREEVLIAEGSDWFWWYGDDHSSEHDAEFDDLYRRHLRNVYGLLDLPVPDELFVPNTGAAPSAGAVGPVSLVTPVLDGRETSYFEWMGAGRYEARAVPGVMHRAGRPGLVVRELRFGCDRSGLAIRVDTAGAMAELLADGLEVWVKFLAPASRQLVVRRSGDRLEARWVTAGGNAMADQTPNAAPSVAADAILELVVPLALLGAEVAVSFVVTIRDQHGELERHPSQAPLTVPLPDEAFEARQWTV